MGTAHVEASLIAANEAFYAVFRSRDVAAMEVLWSRKWPVAVIHPGWPAVHGREAVLDSWRRILTGPAPPEIACARATATVIGEVGMVICREKLGDGDLIATNLFAREEGEWKLVHHQAGPTPPDVPDPSSSLVH